MKSYTISSTVTDISQCVKPPDDYKAGPWACGLKPDKIEDILVRCAGQSKDGLRALVEEITATCFTGEGVKVFDKDGKEIDVEYKRLNFDREKMLEILRGVAASGYTREYVGES